MVPPIVRATLKKVLSELGDIAGRKEIHQLQTVERSILAQLLVSQAQRAPSEIKSFRALTEIATIDESVAEDFRALLARIPRGELSPALAVDIQTLAGKNNALAKVCLRIVRECADDKTRFGKALKQKTK